MTHVDSTSTIGIVVPTLGERRDWLAACLDSIVNQDAEDVRVVIVGPDDGALSQTASDYGVAFLPREPKGLSDAINTGLEHLMPECKYVTWLGDDDLLAPGSLRIVRDALDTNPAARFAYGDTRYIDGHGRPIYLSRATRFAPIYMRVGKDFVPQPGSLLRTTALTRRPVLDPSLRNSMDLDLFLHLSHGGRESWAYVGREVSAYRLHPGAITAKKGQADESEEVRAAYYPRGWGAVARVAAGPRRFLERAVVWLQWRLWKPSVPIVDGRSYTLPRAPRR